MHPLRFLIVSILLVSGATWAQDGPATNPAAGSAAQPAANALSPDSTKLELMTRVPATYPPEAKAAGLQGKAVVKVSVTESGEVSATQVISGEPVLAAACEAALKQWKFKPFIRSGKPIPVVAQLPCEFNIPDSPPPVVFVEDRSSKSKDPQVIQAPTGSTGPTDSTTLVLVKRVKPSYPIEATEQEIQGEVVVKMIVNESGDIADCTVIRGNPILSRAVVDAVKKWKFDPFIRNGKPAKAAAVLSFDFAFKDKIILDKPYDPSKEASAIPAAGRRVRVSAGVTQGLLVYKVQPVYPYEAKQAHIQGTVLLAAVIGKDGRIKDLRAISGPRELLEASIGAVQQWRYRPYLLLGEPVEVDTTITVNFQLQLR